MRICLYINNQVGLVGLLTVLSLGHEVTDIYTETQPTSEAFTLPLPLIMTHFKLPVTVNPNWKNLSDYPREADLFLCVHGMKYVPMKLLARFELGGINIHPFLDKYKVASPAKLAIDNRDTTASVFAHRMTEVIDRGQVLVSRKVPMPELQQPLLPSGELDKDERNIVNLITPYRKVSEPEVYHHLLPTYAEVVAEVLRIVEEGR